MFDYILGILFAAGMLAVVWAVLGWLPALIIGLPVAFMVWNTP